MSDTSPTPDEGMPPVYKRRPRYKGKNPREFEQKYKELRGDPETWEKVRASGKTPAGAHRPIMVDEILDVLALKRGDCVIDCTLGYGGHSAEIFPRILPGGKLIGLDSDPLELSRTVKRLSSYEGVEEGVTFFPRHTNYAGIGKVMLELVPEGADAVLADLGLSSMQIDNPERGFSYKNQGPLDMRMNPGKGPPARDLIRKASPEKMGRWLKENSDEPFAHILAHELAAKDFPTTKSLADAIRRSVPEWSVKETLARVFQAVRIAVNDEFSALETLLRLLPAALRPGGRAAILTFHSGEDRRVKQSFRLGREAGIWKEISEHVLRPSPQEVASNPRSSSAKLRWAVKA